MILVHLRCDRVTLPRPCDLSIDTSCTSLDHHQHSHLLPQASDQLRAPQPIPAVVEGCLSTLSGGIFKTDTRSNKYELTCVRLVVVEGLCYIPIASPNRPSTQSIRRAEIHMNTTGRLYKRMGYGQSCSSSLTIMFFLGCMARNQ